MSDPEQRNLLNKRTWIMLKRGSKLVGITRAARTSMQRISKTLLIATATRVIIGVCSCIHVLAPSSKPYINPQETQHLSFQLETKLHQEKKWMLCLKHAQRSSNKCDYKLIKQQGLQSHSLNFYR